MSKKTFEQALERLEQIANQLENESVPLEKTLDLHREAKDLADFCHQKLDQAESELETLAQNGSDFEISTENKGGL